MEMNNKTMLQLVRNATLKIQYAGYVILVDPVLAEKETLRSALGVNKNPRVHLNMSVDEITKGTDLVLLTHNHIDHYEPSVRQYLPQSIPFFTQIHHHLLKISAGAGTGHRIYVISGLVRPYQLSKSVEFT